jgi:uncharacterized protein
LIGKKNLTVYRFAYRLVVPTAVVQELQVLSTHKKGQKKAAAALKLIEKYETIDDSSNSADEALLNIAEKTRGIVVTNDAELRKRLKNRSLPVIFLRGRKKLVMEE